MNISHRYPYIDIHEKNLEYSQWHSRFHVIEKNDTSQLMRAFIFFYDYNRSCHGTWKSVFVEIRFNAPLFRIRILVR